MRTLLILILPFLGFSQISYTTIDLGKDLIETSGLEVYGENLITHNDSGGEASLYYLSKKGEIKYKRKISSAKNKDWEDITRDDKYIYIADMGNNFNNRKDLKIYKI